MFIRQGSGGMLDLGPAPPRFVFLDIECTGLDVETVDEPWEIAWITDDCVKRHYFVAHEATPSNWVLKHGGYSRFFQKNERDLIQLVTWQSCLVQLASDCLRLQNEAEAAAAAAMAPDQLDGDRAGGWKPHLVGACPYLDDRILRRGFKREAAVPYHYDVIDVEAIALGKMWGLAQPSLEMMGGVGGMFVPLLAPPHLAELRKRLDIPGENERPHCADADAEEAKFIFEWLLAGPPKSKEGLVISPELADAAE
jgi:hypothetical protein